MAKTEAEKREYQRGYLRAQSRSRDRVTAALKIARGYRDRLGAEIERTCVGCARWSRGGDGCLWGICNADFRYEAGEHGMWSERFVGEREQRPIVTQERFGCVNWIAAQKAGQ